MDKQTDKKIIDIMQECERNNINYSLVTNGKIFSFDNRCKMFFEELYNKNIKDLKMYITIDNFHKNYSGLDNCILDNVLKYNKLNTFELYVQSTVTKNKEDNISMDFVKKYTSKGVHFMLNPLLPWGRGKNLEDMVPYLKDVC